MPRSTRVKVFVMAFLVLTEVAIVALTSTVVKPSASGPDLLPWQGGHAGPALAGQPPVALIPIPQYAEALQPKAADPAPSPSADQALQASRAVGGGPDPWLPALRAPIAPATRPDAAPGSSLNPGPPDSNGGNPGPAVLPPTPAPTPSPTPAPSPTPTPAPTPTPTPAPTQTPTPTPTPTAAPTPPPTPVPTPTPTPPRPTPTP